MDVTTTLPSRTESEVVRAERPADRTGEPNSRSLRVLQIARVCHPHESMETRIGWRRALHAARRHRVTVLHGEPSLDEELAAAVAKLGLEDRLEFAGLKPGPLGKRLSSTATTYYAGYRLWHHAVLAEARRRHAIEPFDLVHQTTYTGFREPGLGRKLGVPFVWGPIGGTQSFPLAYLGQLGPQGAWIELTRSLINAWQLRVSPRVRSALKGASVVAAATRQAAKDLRPVIGRDLPVQLETALDEPVGAPRDDRQVRQPLNILWAGRLRHWKTLPLLLKALPLLPDDVDWRLRVLGVGQCEGRWKRQAERLGLRDRVEWLGWPGYRETLPHYRWADAFAFTSMRDTSGTGLLEALAAGTPIVGVQHQGAADIMTPACSAPVPVGCPSETIRGFAVALTRLAREPETWRRLSDGALAHAHNFQWEDQADTLLGWYDAAVGTAASRSAGKAAASAETSSHTGNSSHTGFPSLPATSASAMTS